MRYFTVMTMALAVISFQAPRQAAAQETPFISADYLQARLISGVKGTGDLAAVPAGLELRLAPGWHAYWRMPGDGGLAPELDWAASTNVKSVDISWPAPRRYEDAGLQSFGYQDHIIFPLSVTPQEAGKPIDLSLKANVMVCENICVPQTFTLALSIPAGAAEPSAVSAILKRAQDKLPQKEDNPALAIKSVILGPDAIVAQIYARDGVEKIDLFAEAGNDFYITAQPEITPDAKDPRSGLVKIVKPDGVDNFMEKLTGRTVILTVVDGDDALEKAYPF